MREVSLWAWGAKRGSEEWVGGDWEVVPLSAGCFFTAVGVRHQ